MTATDGAGPPAPQKQRPGGFPGRRKMSISEPTIDVYASGSRLSTSNRSALRCR